jgi:hypothetical protein
MVKNELTRSERERINELLNNGVKLFNHQVSESSYRLARYTIIENVDD